MNMVTIRSVEFVSFTPLVFSTFDGLGREATVFYSRLADLLSVKRATPYIDRMLSWMRCSLSFSLLRSAILALHGSRSTFSGCPATSVELLLAESHVEC